MPKRIPIAAARRFGREHNLRQVVILGYDGETVHVTTWGKTKADCGQAAVAGKWWAGKIGPDAPPPP